jgi:hypothetical protein
MRELALDPSIHGRIRATRRRTKILKWGNDEWGVQMTPRGIQGSPQGSSDPLPAFYRGLLTGELYAWQYQLLDNDPSEWMSFGRNYAEIAKWLKVDII